MCLMDEMKIPVPPEFPDVMKDLIGEILEEGQLEERKRITNLITDVAQDYEYSATVQNALAELVENILSN